MKASRVIKRGKDEPLPAVYLDGLCSVAWYTAEPTSPYLVKAAANSETGYSLLITDLK